MGPTAKQVELLQNLVIYGARGFAREVHQLIKDLAAAGADLACLGFLVDAAYREADTIHGLPVFGDDAWLAGEPDAEVVIAIGATAPRRRIAEGIAAGSGSRFATLVHPRAWLGETVSLGAGSIVCAGAHATTEIVIGAHCQLHVGCTIGHDTRIGDFVTVAPGANLSGRVGIGEGTFIGAGAVVLPDLKVGAWATIGAGAVVTRDVSDGVTVVGVPARIVARKEKGP